MKRYAVNLKLPFNTDMRALAVREVPLKLGHFPLDPNTLPTELMEFFADRKLEIGHSEVFYTPPHTRLPIHIDGSVISNHVKLNWCYGAQGSVMNWFKLKDPTVTPNLFKSVIGSSYLLPTAEECKMVHSAKIGLPTLVNIGQPHSVINCTNEDRWVISLVLYKDSESIQWDDAMKIFEDII